MKAISTDAGFLRFHPLTSERWDDLVRLFGPHGAYGGCWCMYWRTTRAQFGRNGNAGNCKALKAIVDRGLVPGILAYRESEPVGWCSVAPRPDFASLERSPLLRRVDDQPVWSIVCFYIPRLERDRGIAGALVLAAIEYVREQGGMILEAYPTIPAEGRRPPGSVYMGVPSLFEKAGFEIIRKPSKTRLIMRRKLT
ncbi:MAG: GNAT family N-acetyltransferase [Anaerolineales bacterium]|jgi:GNAT superfamily N-acetyltransferase